MCVRLRTTRWFNTNGGTFASVLITISLNTFDRRTFQHIKGAPVKRGLVMGLTMILILITNNLAIGVIAGTLFYYILRLFFKRRD